MQARFRGLVASPSASHHQKLRFIGSLRLSLLGRQYWEEMETSDETVEEFSVVAEDSIGNVNLLAPSLLLPYHPHLRETHLQRSQAS